MTLRDLSKAQYDQAMVAARLLSQGNPNNAADRARFREASLKLGEMVGDDKAAGKLILEAVHRLSLDFVAEALVGLPMERAA